MRPRNELSCYCVKKTVTVCLVLKSEAFWCSDVELYNMFGMKG